MTAPIGSQIGPYRIVGPLGKGGMGEVYRAHDAKLGRDVAIKILLADLSHDPDCRLRFEREARLLAALQHYEGTVVLVSHDAEFVSQLAPERILLLPESQLTYFDERILGMIPQR